MWDADGHSVIDFMAAGGAALAGHGHPKIVAAINAGLSESFIHPLVCYAHEPATTLAERLISLMPGASEDWVVWFGHSGSDAMDYLAKVLPLALERPRLISFVGSFHGMTIGAGAVSGHAALARPIPGGHITRIPFCNPDRCSWGPCDPQGCSLGPLRYLEEVVLQVLSPADETAAVLVEAIQSDSGEIVPPPNFLPALRDVCSRLEVALVADEVKTGLGRTGRMFAYDHWGVSVDAVALGKPLGGGLPLSAVVARRELLEADVYSAFTLGGHPLACLAGIATLDLIESEGLVDRAAALGVHFRERLEELAEEHSRVRAVRGQGLLMGLELDDSPPDLALQVGLECFRRGLLCVVFDHTLEFTPALTIELSELDEGVRILDSALRDVLSRHAGTGE